ncbi:hypothetical protein AC1031_018208 [Aphanomyces cochlioides]|nr:hypothetical protein AC1031_018208 [Aphanomyces cochlioides]
MDATETVTPPIPLSTMGERLASLKVPDLKLLTKTMGLSNQGRKQDLIDRVVQKCMQFHSLQDASDPQSRYYRSHIQKGYQEMDRLINTVPNQMHHQQHHHQHNQQPIPMPKSLQAMQPPPHLFMGHLHPNNRTWTAPPAPQPLKPFSKMPVQLQLEMSYGFAPELDGARCLCPVKASRGATVTKCVGCTMRIHAKCHQTQMVEEWHCEICRSKIFEPFFRVLQTFGAPQFCRFSAAMRQHLYYDITDVELLSIKQRKGTEPGCLELQLRCFSTKEPVSEGHCWPTCCSVSINGYPCQVVQRAVPGQTNTSKVLREQPLNLLQFTQPGRNTIEIRTAESLPNVYVFIVQRVEKQALDHLVKQVVEQSKNITYEQAKADVIKSFGSEDDDDVVATCTMLSVRCPLGLCVIDLPVRGINCQHLQCFDLKTFLMFNRSARSRAWKCIVCHKFIAMSDLRIDPYLKQLLREVADDEELEEVEIFPDATWKKRIVEDEKEKKPKVEETAAVIPDDVSETAPAPAPLVPLDSIDLTLSSDDEEDRPLIDLVPAPLPAMNSLWPSPIEAPQAIAAPTLRTTNNGWGTLPTATAPQSAPLAATDPPSFGSSVLLDSGFDDPWITSVHEAPGASRLNPISADFGYPGAAPASTSMGRPPSMQSNSGFPYAPSLSSYMNPPPSTNGPPMWPATHGIPAKARKRLHRGDELLQQQQQQPFSSSRSAMSMANVIYLDDDSE